MECAFSENLLSVYHFFLMAGALLPALYAFAVVLDRGRPACLERDIKLAAAGILRIAAFVDQLVK